MVLINSLTIDEINAALVHLQRSRTEIVGGAKGDTINNIVVNNSGGGGSGADYSTVITAIQNHLTLHDKTIETDEKRLEDNETLDATQQEQIDSLFGQLEELQNNGIESLQFDATSRYLIIYTQDGNSYDVEITSEDITLSFNGTTSTLTLEMGSNSTDVVLPFINTNQMGVAGGVATLDSTGRVPYSQLPESAMEFLGEWSAATNTPTLTDGTGTNGDFYVCNAGGTVTFGTGNTQTFVPNDRVIYNGSTNKWVKLPAGAVSSVNGLSGDVVLTANNVMYDANLTIKQKIDSAAQADWTETDSTDPSFIKHKIPIWITSGSATDDGAQALFDLVHPIGEIYVQYPATDDPNDLFNVTGVISSTWTKQSYSGAFFRADGGNAGAFQTTLGNAQEDATAKKGLSISNTLGIYSASSGGTANTTASGGVAHTHTLTNGTATATSTVSRPGSRNVAYNGDNADGKIGLGSGMKLQATSDPSTVIKVTTSLGGRTDGASAYSHSHNVYLRGSVSLGNGDTETRPTNYTIQIWKRTA